MSLLSGQPRLRTTASRRQGLPLETVGDGLRLRPAGEIVDLLPQGAAWLPDHAALIVADLHLEKGSFFAARGEMLPPYDTRATLAALAALTKALNPKLVIALGDSFHDSSAAARLAPEDTVALRALTAASDWVWSVGNHDPAPSLAFGGRIADELRLGGLSLRHAPRPGPALGEICGHLHPCARVAGRGASLRRRCFATDGDRIVLPAFGAFTGGLNLRDEAFAPVFPSGGYAMILGRTRLYPAAPHRLLPD